MLYYFVLPLVLAVTSRRYDVIGDVVGHVTAS